MLPEIDRLKNTQAGQFLLIAGPCVIEGEKMAMDIAETILSITDKYHIPFIFKGSYKKANRSKLDSFTGIGDEKALKILQKKFSPLMPASLRMWNLSSVWNSMSHGTISPSSSPLQREITVSASL